MQQPFLPLAVKQGSRPSLVVGGGERALQIARWLLAYGGQIGAVSLEWDEGWDALARQFPAQLMRMTESYKPRDLSAYFLVVAATGDGVVNGQVARDADTAGVFVHVPDRPELSSVDIPAMMQHGPFQIAVGTAMESPELAARLCQQFAEDYPAWYGSYCAAMGGVRDKLREEYPDEKPLRRGVLHALASERAAALVARLDPDAMEERLWDMALKTIEKAKRQQTEE